MSNPSIPASTLSLFTKRRRAYLACASCRQRKIKCVKLADVDHYGPCTRCTSKGIKCEYFAVPEDATSFQPSTAPPQFHVPTHERNYSDEGWTPQSITPPSAGIGAFLNSTPSSSTGVHLHTISSARYPYQPKRASSATHLVSGRTGEQPPRRPHSSSAYVPQELEWEYPVKPAKGKQIQSPPSMESSFYSGDTHQRAASQASYALDFSGAQPGYHSEAYAPPSEMGYTLPNATHCICPPGPCICGANFNFQ